MKKVFLVCAAAFVLLSSTAVAQVNFKEYTAGHEFKVRLPEYMTQTAGMNSSAAIQFKSVVKDVYGLIIFDTKEELRLLDMHYASIEEFYESFIDDFLEGEKDRKISKTISKKIGDVKFLEADATYFDTDSDVEIYYLVGVVETNKSFYKVLSWSAGKNKDKFKADFQKILYSVTD